MTLGIVLDPCLGFIDKDYGPCYHTVVFGYLAVGYSYYF